MREREPPGRVDELRRGPRVQPERVQDRDVAASCHSAFLAANQVRRDPDRVASVLAHLARERQQIRRPSAAAPA